MLPHVVASTVEAEKGGLFCNVQTIFHICVELEAIGHKQPTTSRKADNSTVRTFVNKSLCQQKS